MNKGIVIIAHNNRHFDYAKMSIISGGLAKKYLKVPVTLITDQSTVDWMKESNIFNTASDVFENIILVERPEVYNFRKVSDGNNFLKVPFINSNRYSVYELTPYENTLVIDSDFLIFSDTLNNYWDVSDDVLLADKINDVDEARIDILDRWISDTGLNLRWATTVMFKKNENSKVFFNLVKNIQENYNLYSDLYRFPNDLYRNDIAFTIAQHILNGFNENKHNLPSILTFDNNDLIYKIEDTKIHLLVKSRSESDPYHYTTVKNTDIHLMNKQSILDNFESFKNLL